MTPSNKKGASFIRALVTAVCEIALEEGIGDLFLLLWL